MSKTVCLCMMVRNESHVIQRALQSAVPWVDAWSILDTGSDDETPSIAVQTMIDLPGKLHHEDWVDFATGRTQAFEYAREQGCDYILVMDADQTLVVEDKSCLSDLDADGYNIQIKHGDIVYPHPWLLKSTLDYYWTGATHEAIACDVPHTAKDLTGLHLVEHADSHRRATGAKAREDKALLLMAYDANPTDPRTVFYLAQACADAGQLPCALKHYRERVRLGGWAEEVWCAQYRAARILERQGAWEYAQQAYLEAYDMDPGRAESMYRLGRGSLARRAFPTSRLYFAESTVPALPSSALFVEARIYEYQAAWGLSIALRLLRRHDEAEAWEDRVLKGPRTPAHAMAEILNSRASKTISTLPG